MSVITLNLDDSEQSALNALLDLALKNAGLSALQVVSHFVTLLSKAQPRVAQGGVPVTSPAASSTGTGAKNEPGLSAEAQEGSGSAHLAGPNTSKPENVHA